MNKYYVDCTIGDPPAGGAEGSTDDDKPKFSQNDVNKMLAENKRTLQRQLETQNEQLKELSEFKEEFTGALVEAAEDAGIDVDNFDDDGNEIEPTDDEDDDDDDGSEGRQRSRQPDIEEIVNNLNAKWQKKLDTLMGSLEESENKRKETEERALLKERDSLLTDALNKADCVDVVAGLRYFRELVVQDEETGEWKLTTKGNLTVPLEEGIAENLPSYFKRASTGGGGGSRGGTGKAKAEQAAVRVEELKAQAQKTGRPEDLIKYRQAIRDSKEADGNKSTTRAS